VVLDSGSTRPDRRNRAALLGPRERDRLAGHVKQKQRAVDAATHDWILALDADEVVTPELAASIRRVLGDPAPADGYELTRKVRYLGRWILHCGWYPEWRIRLFDRRKARWGGEDPHDTVVCEGRVGRLAGDLLHYSYRDVSHHLSPHQRIHDDHGPRGVAQREARRHRIHAVPPKLCVLQEVRRATRIPGRRSGLRRVHSRRILRVPEVSQALELRAGIMPNAERLLVFQTAYLGDVVLTTPLLSALKARFPNASCDIAVQPAWEPLVRHHPR